MLYLRKHCNGANTGRVDLGNHHRIDNCVERVEEIIKKNRRADGNYSAYNIAVKYFFTP